MQPFGFVMIILVLALILSFFLKLAIKPEARFIKNTQWYYTCKTEHERRSLVRTAGIMMSVLFSVIITLVIVAYVIR